MPWSADGTLLARLLALALGVAGGPIRLWCSSCSRSTAPAGSDPIAPAFDGLPALQLLSASGWLLLQPPSLPRHSATPGLLGPCLAGLTAMGCNLTSLVLTAGQRGRRGRWRRSADADLSWPWLATPGETAASAPVSA